MVRHRRLAAALLLAQAAGCVTARFVEILPGGGTVAVRTQSPRDRSRALEMIAAKCPGGYAIDREEEVVVGTVFYGEQTTEYDEIFEEVRQRERHSSRPRTEWHIHCGCK